MFQVAQCIEGYRSRCQDRVDVIEHPSGLVLALADGAGGTSGGDEAADIAILWSRAYATRAPDIREPTQWLRLLKRIDSQIQFANGQTTAVVVGVSDAGISGASVGDSSAWLIGDDGYDDLTAKQVRKPLLGNGSATPIVFERPALISTLLLASDGLIKYAPPARICQIARLPDLNQAAKSLIDLVRLQSGSLPDDVSVILCRPASAPAAKRPPAARRRYTLTPDGQMVEAQRSGEDEAL